MAAGAGCHQDQAVDAGFQRFLCVADRNHVVQHDAAVAMDRIQHFLGRRAQAGNDDRDLMLDAHFDVVRQAVVGLMHDLVDGNRADDRFGMFFLIGGEVGLDLREPGIEQGCRARIERRERADDTGLALGGDQGRAAGDKQRRGNHG